jgi:transglutaminase-like putative cysteine protease
VSHRRILAFAIALVLCTAFYRLRLVNGDEWQPISPEELQMTSIPEAPGAPAVILYRQVDRRDLGRGNTEYNYVRIKILTEEGRKYANVEIPYLREHGVISNLRARTVHADGSIVNFDGKAFDQVVAKSKGSKYLAKTFTTPDVQVGSIVEYHFNYDFADGFVYDSHWILSDELFTRKAAFTLKPYDRFAVQWTWPAGLPAHTDPPKQDPDHIIRMTAVNVPAFHVEDYMPPANELKFRVDFVYNEDGFERDQDKYWKKFGKKQYDRVESFIGKNRAMESVVAGIVSPSDPPELKLQKIYGRCQQVRNLSYEPRRSGVEEKRDNFKANQNVEDLWKNGSGSGYDITWLFLALARAAGFDAYPALVASRAEYFFNPKRVNSKELEANIVGVKLNGKDQFFDPGAAFMPYGLLPWPETGVQGRRLDKDGGSWIDTPLPESSASRIERKAVLKLSDEGSLEGKVTVTYTGLEAYVLRLEERNEDDAARKTVLEDRLKEYVPATIDVELKNQPDWKTASEPLVAEYEVKISGWASSAGKRVLLPVGLFSATEKHMFEHSSRTFPIYFSFPYEKVDDLTVELPLGWQVGSAPKPLNQDIKALQYTLNAEGNTTTLHLKRMLRSDLCLVPADKYSVLKEFYQRVRSGDDQQIVLQQGAVAANK